MLTNIRRLFTLGCTRIQFRTSFNLADTTRLMPFSLSVDDDHEEATVLTGGIYFSDYDRKTSLPKAGALLNLTQSAYIYAVYKPFNESGRYYRDLKSSLRNCLPYVVTTRMEFCKSFYESTISKSPLEVKITHNLVGSSSFNLISSIYNSSGLKMASNTTTFVQVDMKTRRAAPIPVWWKDNYAKYGSKQDRVKETPMPLSKEALKYSLRVLGSDIDLNSHTNNINYLRFAEDAIYHFSKNTACLNDISYGMLQSIELKYGQESVEGDDLDIFVWRPEHEPGAVNVHMYKQPSFAHVCQGRFVYFMK